MKHSLKYALIFAGLGAGLASAPAMAHFFPKTLGTFDGTPGATATLTASVSGNYGWIDGTDNDWSDTHRVVAYQFTLTNDAEIQLSFEQAVASGGRNGLTPGFSLHRGHVHDPFTTPGGADHDYSASSTTLRNIDSGGAFTEGSFRALSDWRITNEAPLDEVAPSVFTYIGHAYDGFQDYGTGVIPGGDNLLDNMVMQSFHLMAGNYTAFVGGSDYANQFAALKTYGMSGTITVISAIPEPETYAMLLAGLGLMGVMARRRKEADPLNG
ncbi:FxDxF family PEP-CTERM protein [Nitrosomonas sp.]|uniref:FxDxF family PEP-CTERM protein n=1 Tax=Nitrosomonas sp. TaxID=42353 RepID=UPI0025CC4D38|nr:FxDxF family PEP-CTERM protein [Nitrosomonas sp.]